MFANLPGGSSPLTRGKRVVDNDVRDRRRLIPAHAGKTLPSRPPYPRMPAHPRSRGENHPAPSARSWCAGSSPLTRGKRSVLCPPGCEHGLIPAHAGKTVRGPPRASLSAAHPRSRGENRVAGCEGAAAGGSSPLTRGKLSYDLIDGDHTRLIPAHAGKTLPMAACVSSRAAHPRSRGENYLWAALPAALRGSSPLTRGKPADAWGSPDRGRLIPAHAGKTGRLQAGIKPSRAHPRSRGENPRSATDSRQLNGSSPLTRGKRGRVRHRPDGQRLIPAHAGKTARGAVIQSWKPAHPRSRGENSFSASLPNI